MRPSFATSCGLAASIASCSAAWVGQASAPRSLRAKPESVSYTHLDVYKRQALGWREIVGDRGRSVSIEHFGASADAETLFREFGVTTEAVVAAAKNSLAA